MISNGVSASAIASSCETVDEVKVRTKYASPHIKVHYRAQLAREKPEKFLRSSD